jgi:hypothetical protein
MRKKDLRGLDLIKEKVRTDEQDISLKEVKDHNPVSSHIVPTLITATYRLAKKKALASLQS